MIVKIDDEIRLSSRRPILLLLSEEDKKNISEMGDNTYYLSYPPNMSSDEAEKFMQESIASIERILK